MLRENDMPGGWVAVFVLCLLLAGAVYVAYEGWTAHLMALAFYSSRSGHDERTVFKQQEDRDGEDRH
jgi:hypothetical protein